VIFQLTSGLLEPGANTVELIGCVTARRALMG